MIEAAKAAEVKRIVYTSLLHADVSPMSLGVEHRATEAELKAAGIPHTILRNGWYTENHTDSIGGALAGLSGILFAFYRPARGRRCHRKRGERQVFVRDTGRLRGGRRYRARRDRS